MRRGDNKGVKWVVGRGVGLEGGGTKRDEGFCENRNEETRRVGKNVECGRNAVGKE